MTATAPQTLPLDVAFQRAVTHHQAGRLQEAEQLYRAIVQSQPNHPDANHNLGVLAGQLGQHAAGLSYLRAALAINPSHAQYALSYASALLASAQAGEALNVLQGAMQRGLNTPAAQALREEAETAALSGTAKGTAPTLAEMNQLVALFNAGRSAELESRARLLVEAYPESGFVWKVLAGSLVAQGKEALYALQKAAELMPEDAEAHGNLGNALLQLGRLDDAVRCHRRAVELKPAFHGAQNNLGSALQQIGEFDEAVIRHQLALELKPDYHMAYNNLGNALQQLGRIEEAERCYRRALQLVPDLHQAHANLGIALKDLARLTEAEASCRQALALAPDSHEAHNTLGNVLKELGQLDEAAQCFQRVLKIKPDFHEAHNNLGNALQELGRLDEAVECYQRALELKPDYRMAHSNLLFTKTIRHSEPAVALAEEARHFGTLVTREIRPTPPAWTNIPDPLRPLKVGLVSGDLHNHPVGYFLHGLVAALPPERVNLVAYQTRLKTDALTQRLKTHIPCWNEVMGLSDEKLAQKILSDGIDILIDLSGHTAHNRLPMFAWKPAPVQITWLGYFATTGLPAMDYILIDPWAAPPGEEVHFSEKVWRLPETRLCFTAPAAAVDVGPLPAIAAGHITFGCFGNLAKINDAVLDVWARVMNAVPGAKLFLKAKQLGDAAAQQRLRARFAARGIAARQLILEGPSPRADYLAAYRRIDIVLDTFPFPGGTTTFEALWMGVPVVTMKGDRLLSRQGESILANAGLSDWIAADADDFVARAASHGADLGVLSRLHPALRGKLQTSPLLDATRFAAHFEAALRSIWKQWCVRQLVSPKFP